MSAEDLKSKLQEKLTGKVAILCVGSRSRGDDMFGPLVARRIAGKVAAEVIDAENVPENYLGKIAKLNPDVVLLIDSAHFGGQAGQIRLLDPHQLNESSFSTHSTSLKLIEEYFQLYFKEAAAEMKQYYEQLNYIARNSHNNSDVKGLKHFNRETIQGLQETLKKATDKAETPVVKRRVFREQIALDAMAQMVEFWVYTSKWKGEDPKTLETARKLNEAVDRIDEILTKYQDNRILVRPNNDWWDMYRDGAKAKLATFGEQE